MEENKIDSDIENNEAEKSLGTESLEEEILQEEPVKEEKDSDEVDVENIKENLQEDNLQNLVEDSAEDVSAENFQEEIGTQTSEENTVDSLQIDDEAIETNDTSELKAASENSIENLDENIADITSEETEISEEDTQTLITVRPVKFQEFEPTPPIRSIKKNFDIMQDVSMHVSVELGRTKSSIREVMDLEAGSIVELEKTAGEQVEIFINDKFVAKGEVIVIEDKFGVRVTNTNLPKVD